MEAPGGAVLPHEIELVPVSKGEQRGNMSGYMAAHRVWRRYPASWHQHEPRRCRGHDDSGSLGPCGRSCGDDERSML
jgi:hypothetical protein